MSLSDVMSRAIWNMARPEIAILSFTIAFIIMLLKQLKRRKKEVSR